MSAATVSFSDPNRAITVSWEAQANAGNQCPMILIRADPRGYLLNVQGIEQCSGSQKLALSTGRGPDSDDVPRVQVFEMDNLAEKPLSK